MAGLLKLGLNDLGLWLVHTKVDLGRLDRWLVHTYLDLNYLG